ncbi:MAG TPA: hypothetical protein VIU65_00435 [Pyrinomonadaceae bacterium]
MKVFFALAKAIFGKLPICALVGAIIGAIAGFFFGMLQLELALPVLPIIDVLKIGLLLALLGWLVVLLVVGVWLHYGVSAIALQAMINAILTAVLTVYANNIIHQPIFATLIGLLIGILVGFILCWYCRRRR